MKQRMIPVASQPQGVALITALLIVALVTVAAVAMASRQQLDIRRTANILQSDQAYVMTLAGEAFAKQVLKKDKADVDNYEDDWGVELNNLDFRGGEIQSIRIEDLTSLFNLNNLVSEGRPSEWDIERFKKLLSVLKEQEDAPEEFKQVFVNDLVYAVVDWLDTDGDLSPGGAEDNDYLERERPYRAANRLMLSPSELLLVKGFTPTIYNVVRPYVISLPVRTKINANTARPEIIQALFEDATCPDMGKFKQKSRNSLLSLIGKAAEGTSAKEDEGESFKSPDDFIRHDAFAGCRLLGIIEKTNNNDQNKSEDSNKDAAEDDNSANNNQNNEGKEPLNDVVSVNSEYFLFDAYAEVGPEGQRSGAKLYSLLQRKDGKVTTIMRAQGTF